MFIRLLFLSFSPLTYSHALGLNLPMGTGEPSLSHKWPYFDFSQMIYLLLTIMVFLLTSKAVFMPCIFTISSSETKTEEQKVNR
jgi:hypothetical protein